MSLQIITPMPVDAHNLATLLWDNHDSIPIGRGLLSRDASFTATTKTTLCNWTTDVLQQTWDNGRRQAVVDENSKEMIAFLTYEFVPRTVTENLVRTPENIWTSNVPQEIDAKVLLDVQKRAWSSRVKTMGHKPFIHIQSLCILDGYENSGADQMLVDVVVTEAEKRNLAIYLLASPRTRALYQKNGFGTISEEVLLDKPGTDSAPLKHYSMKREIPRPGEPSTFPDLPRRSVQVLPLAATYEEVEQMMAVSHKVFELDPIIDLAFTKANLQPQPKSVRVQDHLTRMSSAQHIYRKAVDPADDSKLLGIATWYLSEHPETEQVHTPWVPFALGANLECLDATMTPLRRWRLEHFGQRKEPHLCLCVLAVHPDAQRRGVGAALVREGLLEADLRHLPTYVASSPVGVGLYLKLGFEETNRTVVNLKDFGGDDLLVTAFGLVRKAGAAEKRANAVEASVPVPSA